MQREGRHEPLGVTGYGLTTALGVGKDENWRALVSGRSGMRPITRFDVQAFPVKDGAEAPGAGADPIPWLVEQLVLVGREALGGPVVPDSARTALVVGTSFAADGTSPGFWRDFVARGPQAPDYALLRTYVGELLLDRLAEELDVRGDALVVSNACAAGATAVAVASDLIRSGRADRALVLGYDAIDPHVFAGFGALRALAPGPCRPFTQGRAGMKLGDGFAACVLERSARGRVALLGYGESADAHHLTQPDPEGRGAALAMRRALEAAGLEPGAVDYVNAHATATPANDAAEVRALRAVFGPDLARLPVGASKPALGHTLGGAGLVEAVVTLLVLEHQHLPPTLELGPADEEARDLDRIPEGRPARVRRGLTSSFGFGGTNAALVFGVTSEA